MRKMEFSVVRIVIVCCVQLCLLDSSKAVHQRRPKRFIGGHGVVTSHKFYNTGYLVAMFDSWGCVSEQFNHTFADCRNTQFCTGSLISSDFVLTACHCMIFEDFYAHEYERKLPPIPRREWTDIPPYIVDRYGYVAYRAHVSVKHPVLNAMTLMAGDVHKFGPQRRHAAKLFPHHLCTSREINPNKISFTEELKNGKFAVIYPEMDIGLVKSCYPFKLNADVYLAPIQKFDTIEDHLRKLLKESQTCLSVGWGVILEPGLTVEKDYPNLPLIQPDILHHDFRFVDCHRECTHSWHNCMICSSSHGPNFTVLSTGDSGGPLVCDGFVTGVASSTNSPNPSNFTASEHTAVACVKHFITDKHLSSLRKTSNEVFHFQNGHPVTYEPWFVPG